MKEQLYEVERIARAERMLADRASGMLQKLVCDVAASCGIDVQEMLITVRPDSHASPEPRAHVVIISAEIRDRDECDLGFREHAAFSPYLCESRTSQRQ